MICEVSDIGAREPTGHVLYLSARHEESINDAALFASPTPPLYGPPTTCLLQRQNGCLKYAIYHRCSFWRRSMSIELSGSLLLFSTVLFAIQSPHTIAALLFIFFYGTHERFLEAISLWGTWTSCDGSVSIAPLLRPRHSYDFRYRLRTCSVIPFLMSIQRWLINATRALIQHSIHLRDNFHEPQYEWIRSHSGNVRAAHLSQRIYPPLSIHKDVNTFINISLGNLSTVSFLFLSTHAFLYLRPKIEGAV